MSRAASAQASRACRTLDLHAIAVLRERRVDVDDVKPGPRRNRKRSFRTSPATAAGAAPRRGGASSPARLHVDLVEGPEHSSFPFACSSGYPARQRERRCPVSARNAAQVQHVGRGSLQGGCHVAVHIVISSRTPRRHQVLVRCARAAR